jgi:LL-diaminopimelate aminotransferase
MAYLNEDYLKLQAGYLFPEIARRVREFCGKNPEAARKLIRGGIGDVTEPLPQAAIDAMKRAADELGHRATFRGYGPEQGYEFLRSKIAQKDFRDRKIDVADDEIFVSDGSKCDCGFILDILGDQNKVAVPDPVYPVYVDTNVMAGHTGPARKDGSYEGIVYLQCTVENNFIPEPPRRGREHVDLVYLCFPNNPTGAVATREQLARWIDYARQHDALILFDAAYEAYISDPAIPHSIYEFDGARECAIEFRSFSKVGGFTGVRCGFTVMPKTVLARTDSGKKLPLHPLWHRRWSTKSNSVSYPVQRAAEALYADAGRKQCEALVKHYMGNAKILRKACEEIGLQVFGGENAPYVWVKTADDLTSWEMFDKMLREINVVITPGAGFGAQGEGYIRISAFNSRENAEEMARRLKKLGSGGLLNRHGD